MPLPWSKTPSTQSPDYSLALEFGEITEVSGVGPGSAASPQRPSSRRLKSDYGGSPSEKSDGGPPLTGMDSIKGNKAIVKKCCCGLVRYEGPSQVVTDLQRLENQMNGNTGPVGRWPWVDSLKVNLFFGVLIILNSMCLGIDIMTTSEDGSSHIVMVILESFFLTSFWVELFLRIGSHGWRHFCRDPWGPFDFGCTFLGSLDAWVLSPVFGSNPALAGVSSLRTLRLMRLFRLIRVFRAFTELAMLVKVLGTAFQSLSWVTMLMVVLLWTSSILVRILVFGHENDNEGMQELTRGLGWTLFIHCNLVTAEGYLDSLVYPTTAITPLWYFYWVVLIVFLNFFMVNLIVGLVVQKTLAGNKEDDESMTVFANEADQFKRTLLQLFSEKDIDEEGQISTDELVKLMGAPDMKLIMATFGINTDVPREFLLTILGFQDEKYVSFKRFYESSVRICGASHDIRSFMLQYDIGRFQKDVMLKIRALEKRLGYKEGDNKNKFSTRTFDTLNRAADGNLVIGAEASFDLVPLTFSKSSPAPPITAAEDSGSFAKSFGRDAGMSKYGVKAAKAKTMVCKASVGSGFSERYDKLTVKAKKKLSIMERRQEEMLLSLSELRVALFGVSSQLVICCPSGHPLVPLGTTAVTVGTSKYRHWTCDAVAESGGCRHGSNPGSHLTRLRRYHCSICRYDLCEDCYNAYQSERGVGRLAETPTASRNGSRVPSQEHARGSEMTKPALLRDNSSDTPPCAGN